MNQLWSGILRKNTLGSSYLIYNERPGVKRALRLSRTLPLPGGSELLLLGHLQERRLHVSHYEAVRARIL